MTQKKEKKIELQSPKGMHDILPEDYVYYQYIYEKAEEIAGYYGFKPIETPILEKTELFTASLGETSDVVEKQMYSFKTRGGDQLTMRPEGTAPVMRAYIEHGMHTRPQPVMFYYKGPFFRHENPQKGRFRSFQQFGLEIIGEPKPVAEAIIMRVMTLILEEIGITPFTVHINSLGEKGCRTSYKKELTNFYKKKYDELCKDCKRRFKDNPLRLLDCKDEKCIELKNKAPQMLDYLCETSKQHLKEVLEFFDNTEIPYFLDNHLVRGLDYYTKTVFEIFMEEEHGEEAAQEEKHPLTIAAGGRYDNLSKNLSRKDFPAVGGTIGIERIVQILKDKKIVIKPKKAPKIFFIQIGPAAKYKSLPIIEMFRKAKIPLAQSISKDNIRGQLNIASKENIPYALILGQKEVMDDTIIVREMETMEQKIVPTAKVVEFIKNKLKS